jgi:ribosomal protein S18 acetylase RimI-like enzyme
MQIRQFAHEDEEQVIALWHRCGLVVPWNNPALDIQRKLAVSPGLFLVGTLGATIIATVMGGYDGHRGWINYLAVHPEHRQQGYGRMIMAAVERNLEDVGCPKINLQVRASNAGVLRFYERIGYSVDNVISMGKRLSEDPRFSDPDVHGL